MKAKSKTFKVEYTKYIGGTGSIVVKGQDDQQALRNARNLCATGSDFRNVQEVDGSDYSKPRKQGFAGRN